MTATDDDQLTCTTFVGGEPRVPWGESIRKPCEACGVPWVMHPRPPADR